MGCGNCSAICPVSCIELHENDEGFLYPRVGAACIECGKCERVCPALQSEKVDMPIKAFAAWALNIDIVENSSSGGVFSVLAKHILKQGGAVVGCVLDQEKIAMHRIITDAQDLNPLRGSKYVESDITKLHAPIAQLLDQGKTVLFAGTPCQVSAMRNYFGGKSPNLLLVEVICHGVPSRKLYQAYIDDLAKNHQSNILDFQFRTKEKHDWSLTYSYHFHDKKGKDHKVLHIASLSSYYRAFLSGDIYRECCYECPYAAKERVGDITLGDYWGVEQIAGIKSNPKGVSAVLVYTQKGGDLLEAVKDHLLLQPTTFDDICLQNKNLLAPTPRKSIRNEVYQCLNQQGYQKMQKQYFVLPHPMVERIKSAIPNRVRQKIKTLVKGMKPAK